MRRIATSLAGLVADGAGLLSGGWFTFGNHPDAGRRWFLLSGDVSAGQPLSKVGIYQPSGGAFDIPPQGSTPASRVGSATIRSTIPGDMFAVLASLPS